MTVIKMTLQKEGKEVANALISVQIIPKTKEFQDVIPFIETAIAMIDATGVKYKVQPLETTMEGELNELLYIIKIMNEKLIELGSINVMTQIKILYEPSGITMESFTEKYH